MKIIGFILLLLITTICGAQQHYMQMNPILEDTTFTVPIYGLNLRISIVTDIEKIFSEPDVKGAVGLTVAHDNTVAILFEYDKITDAVIFHEVQHAVNFICRLRDIKLDLNNDEPQAYLSGFVGEHVMIFLSSHTARIKR